MVFNAPRAARTQWRRGDTGIGPLARDGAREIFFYGKGQRTPVTRDYILQCSNCGAGCPVGQDGTGLRLRCPGCGNVLIRSNCLPAEITDADFEEEVLRPGPPALVYLWGPNCGVCAGYSLSVRRMAASFYGLGRVLMMNAEENPVWPGRFGLKGVPSVMIFRDGALFRLLTGPQGERGLKEILEAAAAGQSPVTSL